MTDKHIATLHDICMAYPDTDEVWEGSVGKPVWKVNGKIFAMQHPMDGNPSVWLKAMPGIQEALIATNPERWFRPPYVGHKGWIGAWLDDDTLWPEIDDLVDDSWRMTAKKTQVKALDAQRAERAS